MVETTGVHGRIATGRTWWKPRERVAGLPREERGGNHGSAWQKAMGKRGKQLCKIGNHGFASPVTAQLTPEQEENKMLNLPTIDMVATGQNILRLRQQCGFSVKDLQEIFGFATPQAIYKWQHGTALPTLDNLLVLAMVFDVHMEDILVVNTSIQIRLGA